jgi:hypothetical protein
MCFPDVVMEYERDVTSGTRAPDGAETQTAIGVEYE